MADISNFLLSRRNLLSPVPEVVNDPSNEEPLSEQGGLDRPTDLTSNQVQALDVTIPPLVSPLDGDNKPDGLTPTSNDIETSKSGEFTESGKSKKKKSDKEKGDAPPNSSSNEKKTTVAKLQLPTFNFFNKKKSNEDSLIRLFSSEYFDASLAISYLFTSKEPGVLDYIGNRIFEFPDNEMDVYFPQLLNLYANVPHVASSIEKYIKTRCKKSVEFSLTVAWLLGALVPDAINPKRKPSRGAKLRKMILDEQIPLNPVKSQPEALKTDYLTTSTSNHVKQSGHHRSRSAVNMNAVDIDRLSLSGSEKSTLGDLQSGRAFDSGCKCFDGSQAQINDLKGELTECRCGAPRLSVQLEFVNALLAISKRMQVLSARDQRTNRLFADLGLINMNLPARVWVPNASASRNHHIVRIPQNSAFVLNSKEKAPYMVYFEVVDCTDKFTAPIPAKRLENSLRSTKSVEDIMRMHNESGSPSQNFHLVPPMLSVFPSEAINIDETDENDHFYVGDLGLSVAHTVMNGGGVSNSSGTGAPYQNGYETASLFSHDSIASCDSRDPVFVPAGDIRRKLSQLSGNGNGGLFRSDPDDPSAAALKEPWESKVARIRDSSPYGELESWRLIPIIVKVGDDLRLELLCSQFIRCLQSIWKEAKVDLKVSPINVLVTGPDSGFIEPLMDTVSLHQIKKQHKTLPEYFHKEFGAANSETFLNAQLNFVKSVAAYSLICYLLQVKDRHNGNILLDSEGHIIHIDYGFVLNNSPKNMGFEASAFKLTQEYAAIIGGVESDMFEYYKILMLKGLLATRKYVDKLVQMFEVMNIAGSTSPFARQGPSAIKALRDRFHISKTEEDLQLIINSLVESSYHSLSTKLYDQYQYITGNVY